MCWEYFTSPSATFKFPPTVTTLSLTSLAVIRLNGSVCPWTSISQVRSHIWIKPVSKSMQLSPEMSGRENKQGRCGKTAGGDSWTLSDLENREVARNWFQDQLKCKSKKEGVDRASRCWSTDLCCSFHQKRALPTGICSFCRLHGNVYHSFLFFHKLRQLSHWRGGFKSVSLSLCPPIIGFM